MTLSDICWDSTLDSAIATVEESKEACADEGDASPSVTAKTIHQVHQATYMTVLAELEALRKGDKAPAGGVRAERVQLWLLGLAKAHLTRVEADRPGQTPSWYLQSCHFHAGDYLARGRSILEIGG